MTPNTFLKTIKIIHLTIVSSTFFMSVIFNFMFSSSFFIFDDTSNIMYYILPLATLFGISAGNFLYKTVISKATNKNTLDGKLQVFLQASIVKYALLEGIALLSLFASFISNNSLYILFAIGIAIYIFTLKPTKEKIIRDLKLNSEERKEILNA